MIQLPWAPEWAFWSGQFNTTGKLLSTVRVRFDEVMRSIGASVHSAELTINTDTISSWAQNTQISVTFPGLPTEQTMTVHGSQIEIVDQEGSYRMQITHEALTQLQQLSAASLWDKEIPEDGHVLKVHAEFIANEAIPNGLITVVMAIPEES